jgi:hypothetical protein
MKPRADTHRKKSPTSRFFKMRIKGPTQSSVDSEETLSEVDIEKLNIRYALIVVFISTGLVFLLNQVRALSKFINQALIYDEVVTIGLTLSQIAEGIILAAFVPISIFVIYYLLFFIRKSKIKTEKIERAYSYVLIYLVHSIFLLLCAFLSYIVYMVDTEYYWLGALIGAIIYTFTINSIVSMITFEPQYKKRSFVYVLLISVITASTLIPRLDLYNSFSTIKFNKDTYISSEDQVAIAKTTGVPTEIYICPIYECDGSETDNRKLFSPYPVFRLVDSETNIIIDLNNASITSGQYELFVKKQKNNFTIATKTYTAKFTYIFSDLSIEAREQYFQKYLVQFNELNQRPNHEEYIRTLELFTNVIRDNSYYINHNIIENEGEQFKQTLSEYGVKLLIKLYNDPALNLHFNPTIYT